jgi:hypothetical protein
MHKLTSQRSRLTPKFLDPEAEPKGNFSDGYPTDPTQLSSTVMVTQTAMPEPVPVVEAVTPRLSALPPLVHGINSRPTKGCLARIVLMTKTSILLDSTGLLLITRRGRKRSIG